MSVNPGVRSLVIWCPDWPVVAGCLAGGHPSTAVAAVLHANRVIACSPAARAEGVGRGMRRRDAQGRCPGLTVLDHDPVRDAREFEPVASAVEEATPGIEIIRPGLVAVPARGPARYLGGESAAAEHLIDRVAVATGVECGVGVADGLFAATLAARRGLVIEPGQTPAFLAALSVRELNQPGGVDRSDLVNLLWRLGIRTLGAYAALAERDIATRFGTAAVLAHRLARGLGERPPSRRRPPPELSVEQVFDPPVDRVDTAAFAGRILAGGLHAKLVAHGAACLRLTIHARTGTGVEHARTWRCAEPLTPAATADRVRWQLEGWLNGRGDRPDPGITVLRLVPGETVDAGVSQPDLFRAGADPGTADDRAARALTRVRGLLGPDAVLTPVPGGGHGPADRIRLVPWGDERGPRFDPGAPWPGALPAPSPVIVHDGRVPASVTDDRGAPVGFTGRLTLTAPPRRVDIPGREGGPVLCWAGPWPVRQRWWSGGAPDVRCRLQVVIDPGDQWELALLLLWTPDGWVVEGEY